MKYGLFTATYGDIPKRDIDPNKNILSDKCCAKCYYWIECHHGKYGSCTNPENEIPEWDVFSYSDDCCKFFEAESDMKG